MKTEHIIWLLCSALLVSIIANVVLANANLSYYDEAYGNLAQQNLVNSRLREHLSHSNIEAAKGALDKELESKGLVLAICLMENCSNRAKEVMNAEEKH